MSISKKFYSFVLFLVSVFTLTSCALPGVETFIRTESEAKSDAELVSGKIAFEEKDLTVVKDLSFPTTNAWADRVTITWNSENTDVIANDGKVTRPAFGQGDVTVKVTATISASYNRSDDGQVKIGNAEVSNSWTFTVKENAEVVTISKIKDQIKAGTIKVGDAISYEGVIVAKFSGDYQNVIVNDGTAGFYIHSTSELPVGTHVQVNGTLDKYYGIYQTKSAQFVELPDKVEFPTGIKSTVAQIVDGGIEDGMTGGRLVTLTANYTMTKDAEGHDSCRLYDTVDTSKYIEIYYKTAFDYVEGEGTKYTQKLAQYEGKTITITVALYDYKDKTHRAALTPAPIVVEQTVELTDEQKAQMVLGEATGIKLEYNAGATVTLKQEDTKYGATIVWSAGENKDIDLKTGVISEAAKTQTISLTCTVTLNKVVLTKTIDLAVTELDKQDPNKPLLNGASLGIGSSYGDTEKTICGVTYKVTQMMLSKDGIQMRSKPGNPSSALQNTTATAKGIKELVITLSAGKTGFANKNALTITFGNVAGGADFTYSLDTVKDQATYVVTPDKDTYKFVTITHSFDHTLYVDSFQLNLGDGGAVDPKPAGNWVVETAPKVDTEYVLGMNQEKVGKVVYAKTTIENHYLTTTQDASQAAKFVVKAVEGGFNLTLDGKLVYITTSQSSDGTRTFVNIQIETEGTPVPADAIKVFTWNESLGTWTTMVTVGGTADEYVFGTRNDREFLTIGPSKSEFKPFVVKAYKFEESTTPEPVLTDQEKLEADLKAFVALPKTLEANTKWDLTCGKYGSKVAYVSDNAAIAIDEAGNVTVTKGETATTVTITVTLTCGTAKSNEMKYTITVPAKPALKPVVSPVTFDFTSIDAGSEMKDTTVFDSVNNNSGLVSLTASKVYAGNGTGGAHNGKGGMIKFGSSSAQGKLVLTFQETMKISKVVIKCHDFYAKSADHPTNSNTVSVNGSDAVLTPYNETGAHEDVTFELAAASNIITIETGTAKKTGRITITSITVYF